jgi:uncharacterized repeat protein (TIGR03803 family)
MLLRCWIFAGMAVILPAQTLTTLASFNGLDGSGPVASLVQGTDGNFWGTTYAGGPNNDGTIFKIAPGGTLTTLYSFQGGADGYGPKAGLIQATDGNFYGTNSGGGADFGDGTIFRITPGGMLTTLYSFTGKADGGSPQAGLIQANDGNFYGTTVGGGAHGFGTVFKITPGGTLTTLYSFAGGPTGKDPSQG